MPTAPEPPTTGVPKGEQITSVAGVSVQEFVFRQLRLRAAVLIEALRCLEGTSGGRRDRVHLQRQALRWFRDDRTSSPFSFPRVCESLGLEPSRVRRKVFLLPAGARKDLVTQVIARGLAAPTPAPYLDAPAEAR